jgi:hypothetical protein
MIHPMRWLFILISLAANLPAQPAPGIVAGTVTDPDGRPVRGLLLQAVNLATKAPYRVTSSANGEYSIAQLPPGTYELSTQILANRYRPFVRENLRVTSGQTVKVDIQLREGIALNTVGDGSDFFRATAAAASKLVPPVGATPRMKDGKPDFSGYWAAAGPSDPGVPEFQDWSAALSKKRLDDDLKELPSAYCLPTGVTYAVVFAIAQRVVQSPALLVMFSEAPQPPRQIFLDGRSHPSDPIPTWLGHSVGRWEGDTLVVDSTGFNDRSWLDLNGHPHTEQLHVVERYRRPDLGHMELEMTVQDPGALKAPWIMKRTYLLNPKDDVLETVCAENEKDQQHAFRK